MAGPESWTPEERAEFEAMQPLLSFLTHEEQVAHFERTMRTVREEGYHVSKDMERKARAEAARWWRDRTWHAKTDEEGTRVEELVETNEYTPLKVASVEVMGLRRTKPHVIMRQAEDMVDARSLKELLLESNRLVHALEDLGVFESVNISPWRTEMSRDGVAQVFVAIKLVEARRMRNVKVGTVVENGEGKLETQVAWRNLLGHADTWSFEGKYGNFRSHSYAATVHVPHVAGSYNHITASLFREHVNHTRYASHVEQVTGLRAQLIDGNRTYAYELAHRDIGSFTSKASKGIRAHAGASVKSSVKIINDNADTRDSSTLPTNGRRVRTEVELAGLGGDVAFAKAQVYAQLNPYERYESEYEVDVALRAGFLLPFGGDFSHISDRFFLGGSNDMRGFSTHGVGPRSMEDALGGELMTHAYACIRQPLWFSPVLRAYNVQGQLFGCVGNIVSTSEGGGVKGALTRLVMDTRASVGVGIVAPTPFGRLELNYSAAVRSKETDRTSGLQFGLVWDF